MAGRMLTIGLVKEFLHLRRLPLRERAYLDENIEECRVVDPDTPGPSTAADQQYPVDPTAITLMEELRDIVLTDRELADKVSKLVRLQNLHIC